MANPTLPEVVDAFQKIREEIDRLLKELEAKAPGVLQPEVASLRLLLDSVLSNEALGGLQESLLSALAVVKAGKGPIGPGADADLS